VITVVSPATLGVIFVQAQAALNVHLIINQIQQILQGKGVFLIVELENMEMRY
jgi:hypothetical protein